MSKANIMIVEDEWIIADDLRKCLEGMDYRVSSVAASGEEALSIIEMDRPDLVLMDIILGEKMNGIEAAESIRSRFNIPHIFITDKSDQGMLDKAKETEPYGYLLKPFDDQKLHAAIEMALYKFRMEAKRKESEERFKKLVETTSDWIWEVDENAVYTYVSPRIRDILGYAPEEVLGMKPFDFMPKEEAKRVADFLGSVAASHKEFEGLENVNLHKDGSSVILETSGVPIFDGDGAFRGYRGIDRDITDRKRTEEALRESEEKFRTLFDHAADSIFLMSLTNDGLIIEDANDAALQAHGYTRDEMIGKSIADLDDPKTRQLVPERKKLIAAGNALNFEGQHMRKDGSAFPVDVSARLVHIGGKPYVLAIDRDISARKLAEKALLESERKYRLFFTTVPVGWAFHRIIVDEENKPVDYVFLEVNEAFEKLTGLRKENIIGQSVKDVLSGIENDPVDWIGRYGEVASTGKEIRFENYMESLDKWYSVSASSPEKGYFIVVFDDITERKKIEQEREQLNTELAQKNKEMEQLVSVTSHDLRTPLAIVQGYARELEITMKKLASEIDADINPSDMKKRLASYMKDMEEINKCIRSNIKKMDSLLFGLLKLSRSGNISLHMEPLDMDRLLADVHESFMLKIKEAGARVEVSGLPSCIGDETQINQVFSNLLGNAVKYLDPERPGIIRISGHREGSESLYCVEDNGVGIASGECDRIFNIFYRVNSAADGEGLGLTIVRKILERHGGRIWVESEQGRGSRFYVALPA
ncbi:MAG: hypothetical protein AMK71_01575 [Nitrospira bacterium SG8_35_4]|nr:MAG: hypothetical protein AMK71_01575 [Nitrospira bacterium SG8_35_4]